MISPIDTQIDELPMHDMETEEAIKLIDPNSLKARLDRRKTRYFLYCLQSKENGKILPKDFPKELPGLYMFQEGFDGWDNFAKTWDVSLHDYNIVVSRKFSEEEEWEKTIQAKFPQIQPDGSVKYPDMKVKKAVDKEAKNQEKIKKEKIKKEKIKKDKVKKDKKD